jgi:hypothetical protein
MAVEVVTRARMSEAIITRVGDEHGPGTDSPSTVVRVIVLPWAGMNLRTLLDAGCCDKKTS